jgi:hypothetical protein
VPGWDKITFVVFSNSAGQEGGIVVLGKTPSGKS